MPTYDYVCDECGHAFELFQLISKPAKKKCPQCGRMKLRRLIGPGAAVLFRGSGFHQTDYRSPSYKKAAQAATKDRSKTDSNGEKPGSAAKSGAEAK